MELDLGILDLYFEKHKYPVSPILYLDEDDPTLGFTPGKGANSGLRVFLTFKQIKDLMAANRVYERVAVIKENIEHPAPDEEIHDVIYGTLSKYVLQMLCASSGKTIFPEIVPLEAHRQAFFRQ